MEPERQLARELSPVGLVSVYAVGAILWVLAGAALVHPNDMLRDSDTLPDLAFAAATSVVLFALLRRRARALKRATTERDRLVAVVEQTSDLIIITDPQATIEYVNPACERTTGYTRAELIGQNPRIFKSGVQSDAFFREMWATLAAGQPWRGEMVSRRKDGSLFIEEAAISPIRDATGRVTHFAATQRDVTTERATSAALAHGARTHAEVSAALSRLRQAETVEATAALVCAEIASLPGIDNASVVAFEADGTARVLWVTERDAPPPGGEG